MQINASDLSHIDSNKIRLAPKGFSRQEFEIFSDADLVCFDTETGIALEGADAWSVKLKDRGIALLREKMRAKDFLPTGRGPAKGREAVGAPDLALVLFRRTEELVEFGMPWIF